MSFYADPAAYPYHPGSLFLGMALGYREVGVSTERHAITIAGARAGKGACLLIPNALRWPHSLLAVDPKGENAEATWQARQALGQHVAVLDPFRVADVPDDLRATFNPLDALDASSLTAREDIRVIADGLVKRHKAEDGEWYDGAVSILAGVIAFAVEQAPPDQRTFAAVRSILLQADEPLYQDAQRMEQSSSFGGLTKAAGIALQTAITSEKSMERSFLSTARRSTDWMDSPAMAAIMASSSFRLSDLKTGKLSLFLVLPPKYIEEHSTFLRLFVRLSIEAMMQEGVKSPGRCLMLLDEFYSLGRLDVISKSAGLMPGYGLHLWPFLQDIGQLRSLYGDQISATFFSNADAAVFFGNTDMPTLEHISRQIGPMTPSEIVAAPPQQARPAMMFWDDKIDPVRQAQQDVDYQNRRSIYDHAMRQTGTPRVTPAEAARLFGKRQGDNLARYAIVFAKAGDKLMVRLMPYFEPPPVPPPAVPAPPPPSFMQSRAATLIGFTVALTVFGLIAASWADPAQGDSPIGIFLLVQAGGWVALLWRLSNLKQKRERGE